MSMGIVSDNEFNNELNKLDLDKKESNNKTSPKEIGQILDLPEKGRGKGNVEVPNSLRTLIGQETITNGRESALALADNFGISSSSTSAYAHGATSTASYDKQLNISTIENAKERIGRKARNRVIRALNNLTNEKLAAAKARDLAGIAKDISTVAMNIEGSGKNGKNNDGGNKPSFIFYSPKIMTEDHFTIVQVKE